MSYGFPQQPRRRGGIGKLIFPAILFFGVFMLFRSMSGPRENQPAPQDPRGQGGVYSPERSASDDEYRIKEGLFEPKEKSDPYKIKEGLFEEDGKPMPSRQNQDTARSKSDGNWSIQEVDSNDKVNRSAESPQSKRTEKGQWSIEEVDGETKREKQRFRFSEQ
jgi:lipopolysaccharide export LptBFGC system permease protein LptF